jgi:hypothetical protein
MACSCSGDCRNEYILRLRIRTTKRDMVRDNIESKMDTHVYGEQSQVIEA